MHSIALLCRRKQAALETHNVQVGNRLARLLRCMVLSFSLNSRVLRVEHGLVCGYEYGEELPGELQWLRVREGGAVVALHAEQVLREGRGRKGGGEVIQAGGSAV